MNTTATRGEIRLTRVSTEYWRVTFDTPPVNIVGPANIPQLEHIVSSLETDHSVKVSVFDSASTASSLPIAMFSQILRSPQSFHPVEPDCKLCRTCSYASAAVPLYPSPRFAGAQPVLAANSRWRATCGLRAVKKRFYRNGRWGPA